MSLGCQDESGAPVDGWTILKKVNGYQYFIYEAASGSFVESPYELDQTTNGAVMKTLAPLYDASVNSSFGYLFWNDNPPVAGSNSYYAHSKGILATDSTQGFWLVHSMPNWPYAPSGVEGANSPGPISDDTYAQSFRCVTTGISEVNYIASGLRIDDVNIYGGYIPSPLASQLTEIQELLDGNQRTDVDYDVLEWNSVAGTTYYQPAKSKKWDKDLWDDLVAPYFETPLNVETWVNGNGGRQSSICNNSNVPNGTHTKEQPFNVYQVSVVNMPNGESWTVQQDHSKYGFAVQSSSVVTCVGDINRMCSQERRGGGALCYEDEGMHTAFLNVAYDVEACYSEDPCTDSNCYYCDFTMSPSYAPTHSPTASPTSNSPTASPTSNNDPNGNNRDSSHAGVVIGLSCTAIIVALAVIGAYIARWNHFKRKAEERRLSTAGVRSSLDGGSTFGEYVPPTPQGQNGTEAASGPRFDGFGQEVPNPMRRHL
jgi:deoxyribonuclease-2